MLVLKHRPNVESESLLQAINRSLRVGLAGSEALDAAPRRDDADELHELVRLLPHRAHRQVQQHLEVAEALAVGAAHGVEQLLRHLEGRVLELHVAGARAEHEAEVDVHEVPAAGEHQICVVPVLDLHQEARDRVPGHRLDEVALRNAVPGRALAELLEEELVQRLHPRRLLERVDGHRVVDALDHAAVVHNGERLVGQDVDGHLVLLPDAVEKVDDLEGELLLREIVACLDDERLDVPSGKVREGRELSETVPSIVHAFSPRICT